MRAPDMNEDRLLKILLYGAPGTRKTRVGASAVFVPGMYPVLMLEQAGNPASIRDYDPKPTIITMDSLKDYNLPYNYLANGQQPNDKFVEACNIMGVELPDEPFKTVFIDGATEVQRHMLKAIVPGYDGTMGEISKTSERQHFNAFLATMTNWAYKFSRLDMHVIISCLEAEKDSVNDGPLYRRPQIWGQAQGEVASYVYMVMRLSHTEYIDSRAKAVLANDMAQVKAAQSVGFIHESSSFYAKEQYGLFNPDGSQMKYILDPDMQKIWGCVNGG